MAIRGQRGARVRFFVTSVAVIYYPATEHHCFSCASQSLVVPKEEGFVMPNQALQPTPVGRLGSAFAVDILVPAWLSLVR
jgi:hypothetical protein